ncbi:MAG: response regulator, partial [Maribacter sp.]
MGKFNSSCIIDDDEFFAFNAKRLMKDNGFSENILWYTNGQEAIDGIIGLLIENVPLPEVILLDINMPQKDGWEFLEELERIPFEKRRNTSVYITSSFVSPENIKKAN